MKDLSYIELNTELKTILEHVKKGDNITILGPGGSGKSTLIDLLLHDGKYQVQGKTLLCGSTGVAAVNVYEKTGRRASTIHRAFGFGIEHIHEGDFTVHGKKKKYFRDEVKRIIIDEYSMIRVDLMEKTFRSLLGYFGVGEGVELTDEIVARIKEVQFILLGDPLQTENICSREEKAYFEREYGSHMFFSSPLYKRLGFVELPLLKIYRTEDTGYLNVTRKVRVGAVTYAHIDELNEHFLISSEEEYRNTVLPTPETPYTTISTTNKEVEQINTKWMDEIDEPELCINSVVWGEVKNSEKVVLDQIIIKKGCRVMIRCNSPEGAYVNGTIGVVIEHPKRKTIRGNSDYHIKVKVGNSVFSISSYTWEIMDADDDIIGSFTSYPLSVCYAITTHKSQGLSIPYYLLKAGNGGFFAKGLLYTALSRSSNPDGMRFLKPLTYSDVNVSRHALAWNNNIIRKNKGKEEK